MILGVLGRSPRFAFLAAIAAVAGAGATPFRAAAQTGSFMAVLNEQSNDNNGDSQNCVMFFDTTNMAGGPMFAVFMGFEGTSSTNGVDGSAITVDPATGDIYFTEFDDPNSPSPDTINDMDMYRIDFSTVYDFWTANHKGQDVRTLVGPNAVGGIAPTNGVAANPAGSIANSTNTDYVTYGIDQAGAFDFRVNHSNTYVLPGTISKVAEVKRNQSGNPVPFFANSLNFIDPDTLILLDDSSGPDTAESAATDHQYRILDRVSTTPGAANGATVDFGDGGYNTGTSESWNSRRIGLVNLDFDEGGEPVGHSEPESSIYYRDAATGVHGLWVAESDGGGDDIAFLQLDASNNVVGYRPFTTEGNPTSFALDNDPAGTGTDTNDGKNDNIFIDEDTGDLIIVESGFADTTDGIGLGDIEPSVLRLHVTSYDNGGMIEPGTWDAKVTMNPTKTPGDTGFLERGYFSSYDSATDTVYFVAPGNGSPEVPQFGADIWAVNLTTGLTTSILDVDDSYSLFTTSTSASQGDKVVAWTLAPVVEEDADFNDDGFVDGADVLIWQIGLGVGSTNGEGDADGDEDVDDNDLAIWVSQFGTPAVAAVGAVPEPATAGLLIVAASLALGYKRRK